MKKIMIICLMVFAVCSISQAEELVSWENDDQDTANTNKFADSTATGVSNAELSFGPGLTEVVYNDAFSTRDYAGNDYETSLSGAVTEEARYIIDLDFSQSYDVTNIYFNLAMVNANSSNRMATFTLRSSLTGATDLDSYNVTADGLGESFSTDLSGVSALQGITAVDFYLYLHVASSDVSGYAQNGIGEPYRSNGNKDLVVYGESGGPAQKQATSFHFQ